MIFRKGLDMKSAVAAELEVDYRSPLVDELKAGDFTYRSERLTVHLAREFGFCYGVDRAVDYAYQTRRRFPDARVYLTGEIIHNPHVNDKLRSSGIRFLDAPGESIDALRAADVVILPAFGVSIDMLERLDRQGCTLVDTTCGSVLNVWKNVRRYAADGFTSVIHGKVHHEETRATASQAVQSPAGRYLVVLNSDEAGLVCDYIAGRSDRASFAKRFQGAFSDGFDPDRDLLRIGLANQTTMLMSESLEISQRLKTAMVARYGADALADHFRAFDTICSATQDRQDAVVALLNHFRLDLMLVVGGYNSSNTANLARICAERVPTYHVADDAALSSPLFLRHKPVGSRTEEITAAWLPLTRPVNIGLTAGASTPDSQVGAVIRKLAAFVAQGGTPAVSPPEDRSPVM